MLVQAVLDELAGALTGGDNVKLSSFGRFIVRDKPERVGRNPKTGIAVPITQRRVMSFKPSSVLKARINGQAAADENT
jgi:integration host factor subunit alpha